MHVQKKRADLIIRMLKQPASAPVPAPVTEKHQLPEPVAIIGLSGYFPQCNNVEEFWNALDENRSLISAIPNSRINWETAYDPQGKDMSKSRTKWGGVIPDIKQFDPHFFGILGGEANLMDPRKRLLLMSVYHAMENAGYAPASFRNTMTGVFVAVEEDEYTQCMREAGIDVKTGNGYSASLIANELSYFFDLRGSSEVINTMCSGAAVAIHRAVKALRSGEITCALVSAANIMLTPDPFVFLSQTAQMSDTDTVHSFGKGANGFLRSDGVASIVLKPLSQAIRDNDAIYAVIRNTAVNYNGKSGASMATPNISAHEAVIKACYEEVALDPSKL
ncbi:MAG TPA: polyketide synthase, partial [Niastella sp.]